MTEVHTYSAGEEGLLVNAYLVETDRGVVAIDGTQSSKRMVPLVGTRRVLSLLY